MGGVENGDASPEDFAAMRRREVADTRKLVKSVDIPLQ